MYMKEHSTTYYRIRSAVRVLALTIPLATIALLIALTMDDRPSCPVVIRSDGMWSSDFPVDLTECVAPELMVLHPNNTWDWVG
jgi:hypothetical protein